MSHYRPRQPSTKGSDARSSARRCAAVASAREIPSLDPCTSPRIHYALTPLHPTPLAICAVHATQRSPAVAPAFQLTRTRTHHAHTSPHPQTNDSNEFTPAQPQARHTKCEDVAPSESPRSGDLQKRETNIHIWLAQCGTHRTIWPKQNAYESTRRRGAGAEASARHGASF